MPRDLFVDTVASRPAPKRSQWVIVGSGVAHAGLFGALLIMPIVSALDNFVVRANDMVFFAVPAATVPSVPPPPRTEASPLAPDIKRDAAPLFEPEQPVTAEPTLPVFSAGPGVPGSIVVPGGSGLPDFLQGSGRVTQPPLTPPAPVRPGGNIKPPVRIAYTAPAYPTIAKAARIDGTVILEATIDESGAVGDVRVLRSIPLLDRAAIEAVSQWRYTPTRLNGVAVSVILTVTVTFTLR